MLERRRVKHTLSFLERIAEHSEMVRAQVTALPPGRERDAMLEKLRRTETAARISEWLSSGEEEAEPLEEANLLK
jgi:hypothetical protein